MRAADPASEDGHEIAASFWNPAGGCGLMLSVEGGMAKARKLSKRTLIEPHRGDKRYVRRKKGRFTKKQVSVGRSLAADKRTHARRKVKPGQGDLGDVAR